MTEVGPLPSKCSFQRRTCEMAECEFPLHCTVSLLFLLPSGSLRQQHVTKAFTERIRISPCPGTALASVGTHGFILEGSGTYCNAVTNCPKPCGTFTWQQPDAILFVKLVTAMPLMCYNTLPCVNSPFQLFIYWKA